MTELELMDQVAAKLRRLGWLVWRIPSVKDHEGIPDLYVAHKLYGSRWVEVKCRASFTAAQQRTFKELTDQGIGLWVVTSLDDVPAVLRKPPNWHLYLPIARKGFHGHK